MQPFGAARHTLAESWTTVELVASGVEERPFSLQSSSSSFFIFLVVLYFLLLFFLLFFLFFSLLCFLYFLLLRIKPNKTVKPVKTVKVIQDSNKIIRNQRWLP